MKFFNIIKKYKTYFLIIIILIFLVVYYSKIYESFENAAEINPLTLYKSPYEKIRIGRENDGGYLICNIPNVKYDLILCGGINDDTSFEDDLLNRNPLLTCYGFDGTINTSPSNNVRFNFIKKNIAAQNTDTTANLHSYLEKYNNIIVKMDIEGGEFDWLNSLTTDHMNNISQMVIEFHFIQPYGTPLTKERLSIFKNINKTHTLLNFHGNNNAGIQNKDYLGYEIPAVFECLYVNKKYITKDLELNNELIPLPLDQVNNKSLSDIHIDYPPFVNEDE